MLGPRKPAAASFHAIVHFLRQEIGSTCSAPCAKLLLKKVEHDVDAVVVHSAWKRPMLLRMGLELESLRYKGQTHGLFVLAYFTTTSQSTTELQFAQHHRNV